MANLMEAWGRAQLFDRQARLQQALVVVGAADQLQADGAALRVRARGQRQAAQAQQVHRPREVHRRHVVVDVGQGRGRVLRGRGQQHVQAPRVHAGGELRLPLARQRLGLQVFHGRGRAGGQQAWAHGRVDGRPGVVQQRMVRGRAFGNHDGVGRWLEVGDGHRVAERVQCMAGRAQPRQAACVVGQQRGRGAGQVGGGQEADALRRERAGGRARRAGQCAEAGLRVRRRGREDAHAVQALAQAVHAAARQRIDGRLETDDAAEGRRHAHRATRVGADGPWHQVRCHRRGRAAAGATRGQWHVGAAVRVHRRAHVRVGAPGAQRELHQVRLAHDDGAGAAQPLDQFRVVPGPVALQQRRAGRGRLAGQVDQVFQRGRDAVQRAAVQACGQFGVGCAGGGARFFRIDADEAVQRGVELCDALQAFLDQGQAGGLPAAERGAELRDGWERRGRGGAGGVGHGHGVVSRCSTVPRICA
jgi:hypothetical protein